MANLNLPALTRAYIADVTHSQGHAPLERFASCDDAHGVYSVITVGWNGPKRIVGVTLLVTIHEQHVTIQHDGTPGFADYLIEQGVPESAITLAFSPPLLTAA
jgi:XisI protein